MVGSLRKFGGKYISILAICSFPDFVAIHFGYNDPALWQFLWSLCNCPGIDGRTNHFSHDRDWRTTARGCFERSWLGICDGVWYGYYYDCSDYWIYLPSKNFLYVVEM